MLQRLVQRPRVPDGEQTLVVLTPGPADAPALDHPDREPHVERNLDAGAHDLAVALHRMSVTHVEQRTGRKDWKVYRDTGDESAVVHVAAVLARGRRRDGLAQRRRDAEAPEHRRERKRQAAQCRLGLDERRGAALAVDVPCTRKAGRLGEFLRIRRVNGVGRHDGAADASVSVGKQVVEAHRQDIARLGAFDEERAGLRVRPGGDALSRGVVAQGVQGGRDDRVAVGDAERRLVPADGGVISRGLKAMRCYRRPPLRPMYLSRCSDRSS